MYLYALQAILYCHFNPLFQVADLNNELRVNWFALVTPELISFTQFIFSCVCALFTYI